LLIAGLSIAVVVLSGKPAIAAKLQVLPNGQIVVAQIAPSDSTVPVDGRLRGPDSQAVVTAAAWPDETDGYVANAGDRLVAFTVQLTEPTSDVTGFGSTGPPLSLVVQGSPQSLDTADISTGVGDAPPNAATGTGTESYVASVPNSTKQVDLSMTDAGYTQTFSLWSLGRTTSASGALYGDPTNSSLTDQLGITKTMTIRDPAFGTNVTEVFIDSAELSAFEPGGGSTPAPAGHAYLELTMKAHSTQGELKAFNSITNITPLPGSAVTLTSNGHHYTAMRTNVTQPDLSTSDNGMMDAHYAFLVPSSTTRGVVSIGPATTSGQTYQNYLNSGPFDTLDVAGPVRFSVGFPKPPAVVSQPAPPWYGEPNPPTGLPGESGGAASGLPVGGAVVVLALLIGVILMLRRRLGSKPEDETDDAENVPASQPVEVVPVSAVVPSSAGTVRVGFMGSVGLIPVSEPLNDFGRSLVCFLSVHDDRARSVDDAQTALWPTVGTESDISRKTFLNYVSEVRGIVGTAHFPENSRRAGYRLLNVTTDWHEFRRLEDVVARSNGMARKQARVAALTLVRGVPFESELSRWFQWTDSEGLRTEITTAVVRMAVDAHAECVQAGDLAGAEWALRQGLKCNPGEFTLWACLADVVQARGDPNSVERYWRDATASLDPGSVAMLRDRVRG
jgi:hypothetical protein